MSTIETANLIDFSMEDDGESPQSISLPPRTNTIDSSPSITTVNYEKTEEMKVAPKLWASFDVSSCEIFDNNPFDRAEKLANRPDDPFEVLEKEATEKGKALLPHRREVEIGNLLSISADNLLNDDQAEIIADQQLNCVKIKNYKPPSVTDASVKYDNISTGKSLAQSNEENFSTNLLGMGSPPLRHQSVVNNKESEGSASSSGSDVGNSTKTRKTIEHRKRLLKLSLSNSAISSPVSRNISQESNESSPDFKAFTKLLAAAESPFKSSEEDLMSEEPNWIDSEKDFEAELEMLNIPMLKELPSPEKDACGTKISKQLNGQQQAAVVEQDVNGEKHDNLGLSDLDAIRSKLKAKQNESNNKDISKIIDSLKSLICNNENDATMQQQANSLLETLSTALGSNSKNEENAKVQTAEVKQKTLDPPPQTITRQGTFDIDLQENIQKDQQEVSPCDEFPGAMITSSATYDGETASEKIDLILPEVVESHSQQPAPHFDINDIAEQIGKLLGLHQHNNETSGEASASSSLNPTVIFVMNTTPAMQHSSYNSSQFEISTINDGSPDLAQSISFAQRRRSQSLSIHDKVKVIRLPLMASESNSEVTNHSSPPLNTKSTEFKTPLQSRLRRNSFSNGSNSLAAHSNNNAQRRMSCATDGVTKSRHNSVLSTHHEQQHLSLPAAAVVRPMPQFPDVNIKRKMRSNSAVNSILKSTGPMKATIPVKKVSPITIKTSPQTPEDVKSNKIKKGSNNTSINAKANISTPRSSLLEVPTGFPSACSTPATADRGTPRPRSYSATGENKPRFSYLSTTPTAKQMKTPSAATTGVKRRTLAELKSKSPIKPRVSATAMSSYKAAAAGTTATTRGAQRSPQAKTVKGASTTKNSAWTSRTSYGGATGTYRNKENKKP